MAQKFISRLSRVDVPQSIAEGISANDYGVTPAAGAFIPHLVDATLTPNDEPVVKELFIVGKEDRQRSTKIFENAEATLEGNLTENANDKNLLKWLMDGAENGGAGTAAEPRTFFESRKNADGTIFYFTYLGCQPKSATLTINKTDYDKISVTLMCQRVMAHINSAVQS